MAKGYSTFHQLGKIDGRKYYKMKGVEGIVSSSINEGMGNKVKTSAAYANTRLNNAEFGASGNMAGTIMRALTQRWRCITIAFATANLLPSIKKALGQDTTNPWGQRTLMGTDWQSVLRQKISDLSKNSFDEMLGLAASVTNGAGNAITVSVSGTIAQQEFLQSKGITGVTYDCVPLRIEAPVFDANINGYAPAVLTSGEIVSTPRNIGSPVSFDAALALDGGKVDASMVMTAVLVVAKPFREVNGVKYFAQELCSHKLLAIPAAA